MSKLIFFKYLNKFSLAAFLFFTLNNNINAQSYHDCTSIEGFNEFSDNTKNSEEMIDTMELEFAKSLSRFDKCLDQNYSKSIDNTATNTSKKSNEGERAGEELAEKKEQEGERAGEELAEKKEQEGERAEEELEKNNYNNESFNNRPIVDSIASSDLSGTEINKDTKEEFSELDDNNTNKNISEYEDVKDIKLEEGNNSKLPDDIPQDDNDSVLEKQIKLAAMNEKDPEKKKRLWNEYRKYKGIQKKE